MSYKVSVIIPTYNAEKVIQNTINNLKNQTIGFENIELIIVDDNSNDSTNNILKEYEKKYSNIKCILKEDNSKTPSRGRNIGIDNASSEYVMFLDQDDQYVVDICETLYDAIEKFDVDIVICDYKAITNYQFSSFNPEKQDICSFIQCNPKENKTVFLNNFMWNKIFKLDFIKKYNIKCPEGCFCEDPVFCIKSYLNTDNVVFLNKYKGYLYNIGDDEDDLSASNSFNEDRFRRLSEGYEMVIKLLKDANRQDLINIWMEFYFTNFLSAFVKLKANRKIKIHFLNKLYEFKKFSNFNGKVGEKWAEFINKALDKKRFNLILFYCDMMKRLYDSKILRNFYRKKYDKFN